MSKFDFRRGPFTSLACEPRFFWKESQSLGREVRAWGGTWKMHFQGGSRSLDFAACSSRHRRYFTAPWLGVEKCNIGLVKLNSTLA